MERLRIALLLLIACVCSASTKSGFTCKEAERNALLKLKHSFNDTKNILGSWVGEDCCNWKGVGCDNATGHVISLDLRGDLEYAFYLEPKEASYLEAEEVNPALLELKYLRYLDLSGNYFNSSRIPEFLGSMGQLQYLNLSNAWFGGKVPHNLGNLTKLVVLDLSSWDFPLETDNLKWAFKLKNLQHLDLSGIDLSQALDSLHILHNLPSLSVLNLADCRLGNSHLVLRNSTVSSSPLQHLNLRGNLFSGLIPHFMQNLSSIKFLDLSFNNFNETRIDSLEWAFKLENLQYLDLSFINLSQALENLQILHNLRSLLVLNLDHCGLGNSHLVFRNSTVSSSPLQHLSLKDNLFSSLIPNFIQNLSSIRFLDLAHNSFNSPIPSWLGNKTDLEYLNLGSNSFNGTLPHFIENLSFLTSLDLSSNRFSSSIPSWLANKIYLEFLYLSNNHFESVDGGIMNIIDHLCSLKVLDLSNNQLEEEVSEPNVNISRCRRYNLECLYMQNNNMSGQLPTIGSLKSLQDLDLSHNNFKIIPSSFGELSSLVRVDLSHNALEVIPSSFGELSSLVRVDLSHNALEVIPESFGELSSLELLFLSHNAFKVIPESFGELLSLEYLYLSYNGFEVIPSSFGKLSSLVLVDLSYNNLSVMHQVSLANLSSLWNLDISSNSITLELSPHWLPPFQLGFLQMLHCKFIGPFPKWLLTQCHLRELDLSASGIFGPLPNNIGSAMPSLTSLKLADNHINGSIPRSLCKLASLEVLDLKKNRLTGMIPDCLVNSQILGVDLSSNKLSGPIPKCLPKVGALELLSLNNNSLEGELPFSLSNCANLRVLDVGKNNLHGQIPPWNGVDFPTLHILILRENNFMGIIPPQLCSIHTFQIIDLASNTLVGGIPRCFGHFPDMVSFASPPSPSFPTVTNESTPFSPPPMINPNEWSAVEVIKGEEREYTTVLHLLVNMDLSCNNLVGVIPAEITSLSLLRGLNLSHNHFMGAIPKEIGKMKSLESLDLSFNNLSGKIPESITSIDSLSKLNLSFNNLQGQIPTSRHLETLEDPYSIYKGNLGLCGDPLPNKCFGHNIAQPPTSTVIEDEDNKHEKMWFYLVIMLGFAIGFWGVIGILVVKRSWRHAFFHLAEELADWLYVRVAVRVAQIKGGE